MISNAPSFSDRFDPAIRIVLYDPDWSRLFEREKIAIQGALGEVVVEHVGATAVPGLSAKPIIDILVIVPSMNGLWFRGPLESLGYFYQPPSDGQVDDYPFFGEPVQRPRSYHVHVCANGSHLGTSDLAIRDYLRTHPEEVAAYAALKTVVATAHPFDRLAYIDSKDRYVRDLKARAIEWRQSSNELPSLQ